MGAIGHEIVRLDEVVSTNTLVLERPDLLERHGLVVLARHQTGGRGRMGRPWASLPGAQLQFSLVLHPALRPEDFPLVSLVAGLAVAEAVDAETGLAARLKWPNDVLVGGRKVCGILVEGQSGADGAARLVVGIGINCNGREEAFPADLRDRVTTLAHERGAEVDSESLLGAVLRSIAAHYERLAAGDKAALLDEWRERGLLGDAHRVRIRSRQVALEGVPEDLTPQGYLVVRHPDGTRSTHVSGELEWLG